VLLAPERSPRCLAASVVFFALVAGCRSASDDNRFQRHFDAETLSGAFQQQIRRPEQSLPALDMLLATPVFMATDDELSEDAIRHYVTGGNTSTGDTLAIALGAAVVGAGVVDAADGRGSEALEIGTESLAITAAITQILKVTVRRPRPEGNSTESFPSGHASFSFASATFLARYVDDASDGPCDKLGYLAYLPATYVGISRIEGQRHFTSDVTFGAFLGIFLTNWIYNIHHAEPGAERPTIDAPRKRAAWSVRPVLEGSEISLCVRISL
jgi:membrane-associated phospholipid phosphatase